MQKLMGAMRKAIQDYGMLSDGDRVAVGVSGGKDSLALLAGLAGLRDYIGIDYRVVGITIDMGNPKVPTPDWGRVEAFCRALGVEYQVKRTEIGDIIFNVRQEKNPCSLCARMRRGSLHDAAKAAGCNKVALGHHKDDAVETFFMNLFNEGRLGCFQPVTYLSRKDLTVIRPLVLADEFLVSSAARRLDFPVVKSSCPVDGHTNRERMKEYIRQQERLDHGFKDRIFGAICRAHLDGF
ncbi:tRNA 2-thiocytidine biosynthesis TtcA family protein [Bittarella massiliensis (ex Durand et al. 2017)]|uniref:tRNA 2-thiocytidine biosynthesis TtcA family protein n=1 Tax=Bittarella massiliensis (ex Durand et al. 2017) TaxID=1720313 RepID=A0AAW5K6R9_9FIRM|nr:tRNA 2-thiocytidine biosynthesis TtcA family protein [Bittarella massiliensis (ex Durand et al. 2017)]MBC2870873.1 tRNA 2-thiocytidine biosynthesis protein TtcA [Bittarella massiliensis (ex Durand et al. 2017)]MCQ4948636.1 tRNA 2-thiocytidine biosynthesis TtcA family protein [Bittarella massiliensis (ex Durand et al. 2017)]